MIALESVCKRYIRVHHGEEALADLNLDILRGEYLSIQGGPGSGKTVLLRVLGMLEMPSSGSYLFEDYDVGALPEAERARIRAEHFGFVFGNIDLVPELSALENVMLPMAYAGLSRPKRKARARLLLDEMGMGEGYDSPPSRLMPIERQLVAIARALANEPDLILADEPTNGLDLEDGREAIRTLESLNEKGLTLVLFTRSEELASRARRRLRIRAGRLDPNQRTIGGKA
jgi:putative ABC transport system ATP-binding protein